MRGGRAWKDTSYEESIALEEKQLHVETLKKA